MVAVQLPVTATVTVRCSLAPVSLGSSVSSWAVAALAIVSAATRPTAAPPTVLVILTRDLLISCRRPDAGGLPRDGPTPASSVRGGWVVRPAATPFGSDGRGLDAL